MGNGYPKRPSHFANRYTRLLTKTCAAQEIGHVAFTLCVVIAHVEDSKRYTGPVTFYNEQLMPIMGLTKWEALDGARKRAMSAGWLHYEPGPKGQRKPGRYWVTVPTSVEKLDDSACDESPQTQYPANGDRTGDREGERSGDREGERHSEEYPANGDRTGDREGERSGDREGEHSIPKPKPNPNPTKRALLCECFEAFWRAVAPHKRKSKQEAARRYAEAVKALGDREPDPHAFLLDRATAYYTSPLGQTPYCNGPAPWLHQGGYDDDPAAWQREVGSASNSRGRTSDVHHGNPTTKSPTYGQPGDFS